MTSRKIKIRIPHPEKVFNDHILKNLNDYSRFTEVHYGGASSGKSHGVVQKVILKSLKNWKKPRRVLFLRKVGTTVHDSIFADVKSVLSDFGILDLCEINKSSFRIKLPNDSELLFKGMDDPEKIKSIKGISDVVMEEASEFTLDDYTQLTLRTRDMSHKNRQIFLMFNPVSKANWTFRHFFIKKQTNAVIYHTTYKDNKFIDDQTRENIEDLAHRNPAYYKIYAEGKFATLDKLIFPKYTKALLNKNELSHLPSFFGLDFGFINDPSAFIHIKVDEVSKTLYFLEEYVRKGMMNNEIADMIRSLGYAKEVIRADSAEQKSIIEIQRRGIDRIVGARKPPGSVLQGIQLMQQYKLVVDERCVNLIEELENYTWMKDKKTGEYVNKPADTYNHVIDAARYALQGHANYGKKKNPITKKKIMTAKRMFG